MIFITDENKEQQCPKCGGDLHFTPGIEVSIIFYLSLFGLNNHATLFYLPVCEKSICIPFNIVMNVLFII